MTQLILYNLRLELIHLLFLAHNIDIQSVLAFQTHDNFLSHLHVCLHT